MIVDYKYHIASLVAVFLALGIGIVIGSTLLGNDAVIEYQKQVTDRLENQLQSLRDTNENIQARANTLEIDANMHKQFEKKVLPVLTNDKLLDKKFALVELNSYGFPPELTELISDAGGQISSITSVSGLYDDKQVLEELQIDLDWTVSSNEELIKKLAEEMANGIVTGESQDFVDYLKDKEIIKNSGNYGIPVDGVIIVGGSYKGNKRNMQIDIALINYFNDLNIPMVGVEETDVSYSSMKEYQRKHISTIDNIDTAPGQLAMVLALSGKPGHYGVKSSAQTLLPELTDQEG